jgi:hypothetical protein
MGKVKEGEKVYGRKNDLHPFIYATEDLMSDTHQTNLPCKTSHSHVIYIQTIHTL